MIYSASPVLADTVKTAKIYWYTGTSTSGDLRYTEYDLSSNNSFNISIDNGSNHVVPYAFIVVSGFTDGLIYNININQLLCENSEYFRYELTQAYIRNSGGANVNLMSFVTGSSASGWNLESNIEWLDGYEELILYFNAPRAMAIDSLQIYWNLFQLNSNETTEQIGNDVSDINTNTGIISNIMSGISNVIGSIWDAIKGLSHLTERIIHFFTGAFDSIWGDDPTLGGLLLDLVRPDKQEIIDAINDSKSILEDNGGFLSQAVDIVNHFVEGIDEINHSGQHFIRFPGITFRFRDSEGVNQSYELYPEKNIYLEEIAVDSVTGTNLMTGLQPYVKLATSFLLVLWFINFGMHQFEDLMTGKWG